MGRSRSEIFELGARADTSGLDKIDKSLASLSKSFDKLADSQDEAGESGEKASGGLSSWADAAIVAQGAMGGLSMAWGAASGVFNNTLGGMFEQEQAMRKVAAATGLSGTALADFEEQAEDVFLNNWGADFNDVVDAMTAVRNITGTSGDELEALTTNALIMRDTFDADVTESVRAAETMMDQFGITGDDAFDILTAGMQATGDPADDLLDTFNEYSGNFAQMGISGTLAMSLINNSLQAGARNADDVADALREFQIRLLDGSSEEAVRSLGGSVSDLYTEFENGNTSAANVLESTLQYLNDIEDPILRNQKGIEIFGTKWEDMGEEAILAMDMTDNSLGEVEGAAKRAGDELSSGIGPAFDSLKRAASQALINGLEPLAPVIEDTIIPALGDFTTWINDSAAPAITDFITAVSPAITNLIAFGGSIVLAFGGKDAIFNAFKTGTDNVIAFTEWLANLDISEGLAAWGQIPQQIGEIGTAIRDNFSVEILTGMVADFGTNLGTAIITSMPEWGDWVVTNIIEPISEALSGLYVAVATAINNAIPDEFGIDMSIPRPPLPGVPAWIKDGIPNPLFEGRISVPLPANPIPIGDVGDNAAGGSFMVPGGGDSDLPFIMGGVQPGEGINIIPRSAMQAGAGNSGGGGINQPIVLQLDGRQLYSGILEVDSQSSKPRLRRS